MYINKWVLSLPLEPMQVGSTLGYYTMLDLALFLKFGAQILRKCWIDWNYCICCALTLYFKVRWTVNLLHYQDDLDSCSAELPQTKCLKICMNCINLADISLVNLFSYLSYNNYGILRSKYIHIFILSCVLYWWCDYWLTCPQAIGKLKFSRQSSSLLDDRFYNLITRGKTGIILA